VALRRSDAQVEAEYVQQLLRPFGLDTGEEKGDAAPAVNASARAPLAPGMLCRHEDADCRNDWCAENLKDKERLPPLRALGFPLIPPVGKLGRFNWTQLVMHQEDMQELDHFDKRLLPRNAHDALGHLHWGKRCAVVGNAGHLSLTKYGKEIDAYDVVVRLNQAPTKGYEERVGTKTTMRIMNRLWSVAYGRYDEQVKRLGLPLEKGVTLVASRGEDLLKNFHRMKTSLAKSRPVVPCGGARAHLPRHLSQVLEERESVLAGRWRAFVGDGSGVRTQGDVFPRDGVRFRQGGDEQGGQIPVLRAGAHASLLRQPHALVRHRGAADGGAGAAGLHHLL